MKKIVLLLNLCLLATAGVSQVICRVTEGPNEGNYGFTYAEPTGGAPWGVEDLTDPANAVSGDMVLVDDGTGLDNPIACVPVTDGVSGKVAVLYRGSCEFGVKAKNAEDQGAIAVIIINNLDGEPVAMGAGAEGASVTVPVVMISNVDGALLRDDIDAGETEVFIGSKVGLYANDLGMRSSDVLRTKSFGNIQLLSQNASEFSFDAGAWVRNYGTNDQTNVKVNLTISLEGAEVYNVTTEGSPIPSGDSVYFEVGEFSQETYANGYYEAEYSIVYDNADESDYDNTADVDFMMSDDYYSMSRLDPTTSIPVNSTNQFNGTTDNLYSCVFFENANASRIAVEGMNFSGGTSQNPDPTSIDGQLINTAVYEWNDVWTDLNDEAFAIGDLEEVASAEYIYTGNLQGENIYIPFEEPAILVDDQRYIACVQMYGDIIYPGYDTKTDYSWNVETYAMPTSPIFSSGSWFALGFGADRNPSISLDVAFYDVSLVELPASVELEAFPNPSNHIVHIPVQGKEGDIRLTIVDLNGKVVGNQTSAIVNQRLDVDVTAFAAGMYTVNLVFADGTSGSINVVVSK